ncbi:unnamed protein product, partial [Phaeothamnion confervicola]
GAPDGSAAFSGEATNAAAILDGALAADSASETTRILGAALVKQGDGAATLQPSATAGAAVMTAVATPPAVPPSQAPGGATAATGRAAAAPKLAVKATMVPAADDGQCWWRDGMSLRDLMAVRSAKLIAVPFAAASAGDVVFAAAAATAGAAADRGVRMTLTPAAGQRQWTAAADAARGSVAGAAAIRMRREQQGM